jgi:hypothetical protein
MSPDEFDLFLTYLYLFSNKDVKYKLSFIFYFPDVSSVMSSWNFSYITPMTGTTKFLYKNCSHGQKRKVQIFKRPPSSNSPEIVPQFQEDPGFWSAEQLEPDKSMSKVQGKLKSQAWPQKWIWGIPRPHLPSYGLTARSEPVCRSLDTDLWGIPELHIVTLPHRAPSHLHHQETTSELSLNIL